jgi:hypothetical protein
LKKGGDVIEGARSIEIVLLDSLQPYEKNCRIHSKQQIKKLSASIKEFGFTNPVLVGGNLEVIAGHGRIEAARLLGMAEVPVIRLGYLSEQQRRALVIADNKLALDSSWDFEKLYNEIEQLKEDGVNLDEIGIAELEMKEAEPQERQPKMTTDYKYKEEFALIIICENKSHQTTTLSELEKKGYKAEAIET